MTEQARQPSKVTDPTGKTVAKNVRRFRERRGWSTYELSRILKSAGRPIAPSALAKIEREERRVDVGDLASLATALGVNPSALLLPHDAAGRGSRDVEITGAGTVSGWLAWAWADGVCPLVDPEQDKDGTKWLDFAVGARPIGWDYARDKTIGIKRGRAQLRKAFGDHYAAIEAISPEGGDDEQGVD